MATLFLLAFPDIYGDRQKFTATEKELLSQRKELEKLQSEYESAFEKLMELEMGDE